MAENEQNTSPEHNEENGPDNGPDESSYVIASAIATVLEDQKVIGAIGNWVNAHAVNKPHENKLRWGTLIMGQIFGLVIFVGVLIAGWQKIISTEATTGLLGALVGYWYGQREKQR